MKAATKLAMNDRYAESIIGARHGDYDAVEIHGVRDLNSSIPDEGTCCEIDDANPQFFSVYAHLKAGGVECIGDFQTHAMAIEYAKDVAAKYEWNTLDCVLYEHVISYAYPTSDDAVRHGFAIKGCYTLAAKNTVSAFPTLDLALAAAKQFGTVPGRWSIDFAQATKAA